MAQAAEVQGMALNTPVRGYGDLREPRDIRVPI